MIERVGFHSVPHVWLLESRSLGSGDGSMCPFSNCEEYAALTLAIAVPFCTLNPQSGSREQTGGENGVLSTI